ncbi:MAG: FAD-dependent oxidoreductase [bacterium]|nr:FAD-dependent oxidoreductase [bacterium]
MSANDVIIIGGGISGLAVLHYLRRDKPQLKVRLLEAEPRLGGTIGTDRIDGYSFDSGTERISRSRAFDAATLRRTWIDRTT